MLIRAPRSLLILGLLLVAAVVVGAVKIMAEGGGEKGWRGQPPATVGAATVKPAEFVEKINAIGTARANESVEITAKVTETVRSVSFDDGDRVEAGAILVELTNAEDAAALHSAQATLNEARKSFQRVSDLLKTGSATRERLEQARSQLESAQGQVDAIAARLADRLIRAPFAGILGLRQVSQGTLVRPGEVITTLDDVSTIKLDFTVPETFLGALSAGLDIRAKSPAFPNRNFEGRILAVDTRIDPVTRAVTVRAGIPNPDLTLRPGLLMTVEVIRAKTRSLAVPQRALVAVGDEIFVYRIKGNTVEKAIVQTGQRQEALAQITSGLAENDVVVVDGTNRVRPGEPIQIVERDGVPVAPPAGRPGPPHPQS